jgi:hypothetical protein
MIDFIIGKLITHNPNLHFLTEKKAEIYSAVY